MHTGVGFLDSSPFRLQVSFVEQTFLKSPFSILILLYMLYPHLSHLRRQLSCFRNKKHTPLRYCFINQFICLVALLHIIIFFFFSLVLRCRVYFPRRWRERSSPSSRTECNVDWYSTLLFLFFLTSQLKTFLYG